MKLQPDDEPRSSLCIGPGSKEIVGPRREFTRRFAKGIGKLAGNTLGDHWKKTGRLTTNVGGCQIGRSRQINCPYLVFGRLTIAQAGQLNHLYPGFWVLSAVDPPRPTGIGLHPKKIGSGR
ncbi:hypothetical protein B296_00028701 [Ensete ventricosum]|uniref:Uncharacterized protein n=1 Tax=Ensete ventricosum TaxID=4639 RepID=A0A426X0B6_ENSVE|nr:hypothetical protein B296_00028701 [Ensete ventricosum]